MSTTTLILDHKAILTKLQRLAWEVYENHYNQDEIVVIGIKERGKVVADLLCDALGRISDLKIDKGYIELNASNPAESVIEGISGSMENKRVLLVDDVLNTGRTLMLATVPILLDKPSGLQTVILADRDHKKFAISADYVGISLATTLQEHITFSQSNGEYSVSLD